MNYNCGARAWIDEQGIGHQAECHMVDASSWAGPNTFVEAWVEVPNASGLPEPPFAAGTLLVGWLLILCLSWRRK